MRIADDSIALVGQGSRGTGHGRRSMDSSGASFCTGTGGGTGARSLLAARRGAAAAARRDAHEYGAGKARQYDRRMREKGAREALIYMKDSTAMVVSVTNRTVITALDDVTAADSIFTNIDSAAII